MEDEIKKRAVMFVDGFNLYNGMKDYIGKGQQNCYWLDLERLGKNIVKSDEALVAIHYFSAFVKNDSEKLKRQLVYLKALHTIDMLKVRMGEFKMRDSFCRNCNYVVQVPTEKQTDVSIASFLITDAAQDIFDVAYIVSGDTDLLPAVEAVRRIRPGKEVVVAFPPNRSTEAYKRIVRATIKINASVLSKSQFPIDFLNSDGYAINCPVKWRNDV